MKNDQALQESNAQKKKKLLTIIIPIVSIVLLSVGLFLIVYFTTLNQKTVTIYFHTNQTQEAESITVKRKDDIVFPTLQRQGYEFLGWSLDSSSDNVFLVTPAFIKDNFKEIDELDLYAVWNIIDPVLVTYDSKGGTPTAPSYAPRNYALDPLGKTEREGYYFLGWCYDEQCLCVYNPDVNVITEACTLYAKWVPSTLTEEDICTVTFVVNDGPALASTTSPIGEGFTFPENYYRTGYVLEGWYSDAELKYKVDEQLVLSQTTCTMYASWKQTTQKFTISFILPDDCPSNKEDVELPYATYIDKDFTSMPEWADHVFDSTSGYYIDVSRTSPEEFPYYLVANKVYYVKYKYVDPSLIKVYFVVGEEDIQEREYSPGATIEDWTPTFEGYVFKGWFYDSELTNPVNFALLKASAGLYLYAKWEEAKEYQDENFSYELLEDGSLMVYSILDRNATTIVIPDSFGGLPITAIAEGLFSQTNRAVESVTIGNNIQSIPANAFENCNVLRTITVPVSVKRIESYAFANASALEEVVLEGQPDIGDKAFYNCYNLTSINLELVMNIGERAFEKCTYLPSVNLQTILSLGNGAFMDCASLASVQWQYASIKTLPASVFANCVSLTSLDFPTYLEEIKGTAFAKSGLRSLNTKNVKIIAANAFSECYDLSSVTIGKALETLGEAAFYTCKNLTQIVVDSNNEKFSSYKNSLFNKEKTVLLQGAGTTIELPSSITTIQPYALMNCVNVVSYALEAGCESFSVVDGNLYNKTQTTLVKYASGKDSAIFEIPETVTVISPLAFSSFASLTDIVIPSSVTNVEPCAFYNSNSLLTITVKGSVEITFADDSDPSGMVYQCPNVTIVRE